MIKKYIICANKAGKMQEPKLNEEELIGLSEEEKQQKIAELEQRKKEY